MTEYRRGNDGSIEVDETGNHKVLSTGETRWIAIEPSSKKFKYETHWGAAAYPKKVDDAKKAWQRLAPDEVRNIAKRIHAAGMEIPFHQIAATYVSLHGGKLDAVKARIRQGIQNGQLKIPHLRVMAPKSVAIGIINKKHSIGAFKAFPTTYGDVPFQSGMLILVKLDWNAYHRRNILRLSPEHLMYPIDAPAVKAALWKPVPAADAAAIQRILEQAKAASS